MASITGTQADVQDRQELFDFLDKHKLSKYYDLFCENDCYPLSVLQHIDDSTLKEWGLKKIPRKAIMHAIASEATSLSSKPLPDITCLGKLKSGKDCTSKTFQANGYCGRHQKQATKGKKSTSSSSTGEKRSRPTTKPVKTKSSTSTKSIN